MYAARGGPYKSLQQGPGSILPYGDCLLLLALQDALRELSAQAFIRHDAAETIAATAQQEFLAHLVRLAPSLPSICLSGQLLLYRYRQQRWLLVLQRVRGAVISPSPQRRSPLYPIIRITTANKENVHQANRVDIAVAYLRRQRKAEYLPFHSARAEATAKATPKYNLKNLFLLGEASSHRGREVRAAGSSSSQRRQPETSERCKDETDELEIAAAAADSGCISAAADGAAVPAASEVTASRTVAEHRVGCGEDLSEPPVLEGVSFFNHDGPIRASMPSLHAHQVTSLIAAALEASKKPVLYSRPARAPERERKSAITTRISIDS